MLDINRRARLPSHRQARRRLAVPDHQRSLRTRADGRFFGLTMPIRREDREAFEAQLTLYAVENGFADESELQQVIEALRTAVRRHNSSFQNSLS